MALHLFEAPHPSRSEQKQLRLLVAYENGGVVLFAYTQTDKLTSVEGVGWDKIWRAKVHVESGTPQQFSNGITRVNSLSSSYGYGRLSGQFISVDSLRGSSRRSI
jgi:hypothetical protein